MSNIVELREVSELITKGTTPTTVGGRFTNAGINFVKSESICDSKYLDSSVFMKIDEETDEKLKRSRLKERDLLVSIAGAYLGKLSIVRDVDLPANTNQAVGIVRINPEKADVDYLYYYFSQPAINGYINKLSAQSSQPNLNLDLLGKLTFNCLELEGQVKVATVLSAIDKKIELNNHINAELESMAKTLYDYWFVQFDFPDANGKPYKSSGGKMVYNPTLKREIPEGWDWKPVSSIIEVKDGTHDSPKPSDSGQYLITSKHLKPSGIDLSDAYLISQEDFDAVNKRSKVDEGDFLLSMIGTVGLSQWAMKIETPYAIKNIGLFKTSQAPEMADYIFAAVTSLHGRAYLQQNQSTGTSQPYVTLGTLRSIPILIPNGKVFEQFNGKIKPIHKLMYENITENQKLAQLRDWLLPMLMNGQVTVK